MTLTTERIKELASKSKRITLPGQTDLHMESRTFRHDLTMALNELLEYRDAEEQAERELAETVEETGADPNNVTLAGTRRLMPIRAEHGAVVYTDGQPLSEEGDGILRIRVLGSVR